MGNVLSRRLWWIAWSSEDFQVIISLIQYTSENVRDDGAAALNLTSSPATSGANCASPDRGLAIGNAPKTGSERASQRVSEISCKVKQIRCMVHFVD